EKALAACDRGIAAIPDDEYFPLAKARILMKLDNLEDAVPLLEKAHELEPDNLDITEILMQSLAEVSRIDEAYEHAQDILEKDEDNARAHMVAGDYKRLKGDLEEALEEYEAASQDIETKAYAEHYKEVVEKQLEEKEIEEEYEEQLEEDTGDSQESAKSNQEQTENQPKKTTPLLKKRGKKVVATQYVITTIEKNKSGIIMLVLLIVIVITIVALQAYTTYRKR
ncbi:tetratricopeptide repeat protein, partial [Candidatus Latescibacterota bacterium]